jgi:hypothetical protein
MNIPGFTAEASLAKSVERYALVPVRATSAFGGALIPQLRRLEQPCIPGCICVSPIDCPCCNSIDSTDPFLDGTTVPFQIGAT